MKNKEFKSVFKKEAVIIWITLGKETEIDPIEKNTRVDYFNPIPIKAIVTDLTATQAKWKSSGVNISRAKSIIVEIKNRNLIELSQKITIDEVDYIGWKERGKMQTRKYMNYLDVLVYTE